MKITPTSNLVFRYLTLPHGIGGRGGVQRFFLLANGIPFREDLYGDAWGEAKARMLATDENPCGSAPVICVEGDDTVHLSQHIASSRYIANVFDVLTGDPYKDYVQDLVCDEYQGFRDAWVDVTFNGSDEQKSAYRKETLPKLLDKFDRLYKKFKTEDAYLSVGKKTGMPLWGDAAVFGLVRDHVLTGHMSLEDLDRYEHLLALYKAYEKIGPVAEWIEAHK